MDVEPQCIKELVELKSDTNLPLLRGEEVSAPCISRALLINGDFRGVLIENPYGAIFLPADKVIAGYLIADNSDFAPSHGGYGYFNIQSAAKVAAKHDKRLAQKILQAWHLAIN